MGFEFPVFNFVGSSSHLGHAWPTAFSRLFQPEPIRPEPLPHPPEYLEIDYQKRGGSFIIIGPNPQGIFAQPGYWWNEIDIVIENKCANRIYFEPNTFRLYISSQLSTENTQEYLQTIEGLEYQPNRLTAGWLEPDNKTLGRLLCT